VFVASAKSPQNGRQSLRDFVLHPQHGVVGVIRVQALTPSRA